MMVVTVTLLHFDGNVKTVAAKVFHFNGIMIAVAVTVLHCNGIILAVAVTVLHCGGNARMVTAAMTLAVSLVTVLRSQLLQRLSGWLKLEFYITATA